MKEIISKIKALRKKGFSWFEIAIKTQKRFHCLLKDFISSQKNNFIKITQRQKKNRVYNEKSVVILETGVLGDVLLVTDAFKSFSEYCKENGLELTIICASFIKKLLYDYAKIETAKYVCFENREKFYIKEILRILKLINKQKHEFLLMRDSNPYAINLSQYIYAKEKLFYSYDLKTRLAKEKKIMEKSFTEIKCFDKNTFIPDIWKEHFRKVGFVNYETKIGRITVPTNLKINTDFIPKSKYILIMPEASNTMRCMEIEKFEEILNYLALNYSAYKVIVCLPGKIKNYASRIKDICDDKNLVCLISETSFDQFVFLVSKTSLLISCDSGQVHLAASLAVPSVSLSGYWDGPHFFPYKFDVVRKDDKIPVNIYARFRRECQFCGEGTELGWLKDCRKRVFEDGCFLCLHDIETKDILKNIDKIMVSYKQGNGAL